jgi:hypothetical protein
MGAPHRTSGLVVTTADLRAFGSAWSAISRAVSDAPDFPISADWRARMSDERHFATAVSLIAIADRSRPTITASPTDAATDRSFFGSPNG